MWRWNKSLMYQAKEGSGVTLNHDMVHANAENLHYSLRRYAWNDNEDKH